MKHVIIYISLFLCTISYSQGVFTITENGLSPKFTSIKIDSLMTNELYSKTLKWIKENEKKFALQIKYKFENEKIHLISIKRNAVNLDRKYFNAQYKITISFDKNEYKFEPKKLMLKVNSKYDMGWNEFDLSNGSIFFKKNKVIKKYRSYLRDIPDRLNELNDQLRSYLTAD